MFPTQRVEVGPHPRDMVQIREGQPFTVPAGKILVVTAVGRASPQWSSTNLRINGNVDLNVQQPAPMPSASPLIPLPTGLTYVWGTVVEPDDGDPTNQQGRAWGYLAER